MEDRQIVDLFWDRDQQALIHTQEKYSAYCATIAQNILENKEDAQECVNDTWLCAWNTIPPNRPDNLQFYLAKITRNQALDRYRKEHAEKRGAGEMCLALEELAECVAAADDPQKTCQAKELEAAINRFVRSLPVREGNVFIRRYYFMESACVIGDRYGMTPNHVAVILSRVRGKLKKHLKKEGLL